VLYKTSRRETRQCEVIQRDVIQHIGATSTGIGMYQHVNHENHMGILTIVELREAEETCSTEHQHICNRMISRKLTMMNDNNSGNEDTVAVEHDQRRILKWWKDVP
jgi:hypothetical protein